ncbi:helix-turn-helix domain-containing protein [Kitasatospora sp. NPDC059673]|uniref:helix-turn-helix domain-containing protein n=1 Tax=Kitasatospora sp. NPDC059673 TaxID=3346901 RepID=UPI0036D025B6
MKDLTEVDGSSSPALRFGEELRRSRRGRGWAQTDLADRMHCSGGLISYIERGKKPISFNFAVKADEVFGAGERFQVLWRQYNNASLLEGFPEFVEAEARCLRLCAFELGVVPGLLQTPAYATAFEAAGVKRGRITQDQADERVKFLLQRQEILTRAPEPRVHIVMDESCLLRPIGGREVMTEQLEHLEALAGRPNITLQVAPFEMAEYRSFRLPTVLLTLPGGVTVGYVESQLRGYVERGRDAVSGLVEDYHQLQVESLSTTASLAKFRAVREGLSCRPLT